MEETKWRSRLDVASIVRDIEEGRETHVGSLRGLRLGKADFRRIATAVAASKTMMGLRLSDSGLSDEEANVLAEALMATAAP